MPTQPSNNPLILATDALGGDGFPNKIVPDAPVLSIGYGLQSLSYQEYNYMVNNFGSWIDYLRQVVEQMRLPVGAIFEIRDVATNPNTLLGYGTWVLDQPESGGLRRWRRTV